MKIKITTIEGYWDDDVQIIFDVLNKRAKVYRDRDIPLESGGGAWFPYGLAIFLAATGIIAKKFLEELGNDLYQKFKQAILSHLKKEDVYIFLTKNSKIIIGFRIAAKRWENGQVEIPKTLSRSIDILPNAFGDLDNFELRQILKHLHKNVYLVIFEHDNKKNKWLIADIHSRLGE